LGSKTSQHVNEQCRRWQKLFHTGKDHVLNINLCGELVILLTFAHIQTAKTGLFGKSNSVSFMFRRFVYNAMEHWIVPRQGHFISSFLQSGSFQIITTALQWPFRGKFVHGLVDMLFTAYHTSRYMNTTVCACPVLVQRERFSFSHHLWTHGTTDLLCFPWQPQNAQWLQSPDILLTCFLFCSKQGAGVCNFFPNCGRCFVGYQCLRFYYCLSL